MTDHAVVVGNGPAPSRSLLVGLLEQGGLLLCADGGANTIAGYGLVPDAVVGDLDSVDSSLQQRWTKTEWVKVDADDTGTDLQKVLDHAHQRQVRSAVLTGGTGARTDHTLWNLSLLGRFADRLDLAIVDDDCLIRLISGLVRFEAPLGLKLSLCPLAGPVDGITTQGLRWSLNEDRLVPGERDGISNETVDSTVEIRVDGAGHLLLIVQWAGQIDLSLIPRTAPD